VVWKGSGRDFGVREGGFILDIECTSRVIKFDSKQKQTRQDARYLVKYRVPGVSSISER
jgi:hypothetical protein